MNSYAEKGKKPVSSSGDEKNCIPYSLEWIKKNAPWQWREKTGRDKNTRQNDGMGQRDDSGPISSPGRMDHPFGPGSLPRGGRRP